MPCDTRLRTSVPQLAAVNRGRLAAALQDAGWTVTVTGQVTATADNRTLLAAREGVSLRVGPQGATCTTGYDTITAEEAVAAATRAYAARTVADVSAQFGFRVRGTEELLAGARRIVLTRS